MKIKAKENKFDECSSSFKVLEVKSCCEKILDCGGIVLNREPDDDKNDYCHEFSVKIVETQIWADSYDNIDPPPDFFYHTIKYCPFCGQSIEVEIVETEDLTKDISELDNRIEKLRKLQNETDSKKEEARVANEIRTIDKKRSNLISDSDTFETIDFDMLHKGLSDS